jgi:hypothetical protein
MPTITATTPISGQTGTLVRITGTGFAATPRVLFGKVLAQYVLFISATELRVRVPRAGAQATDITVINPDLTEVTYTGFTVAAPGGWGKQGYGVTSFGASVAGSVAIRSALAVSTREVDVTTTGPVQDNSPFFAGDALNPSTWQVQRLDSFGFFTVVAVTQVGTNTYRLSLLEELGPAAVEHLALSSSLLDASGSLIITPRQASFLGILDEATATNEARMATRRNAQRDYANPQTGLVGGTMLLDAGGDYQMVTGGELVKKLILRRLVSAPRDFFHLPEYGLGFRDKEPLRVSDVGRFKVNVERQVLEEPEVEECRATVTLEPSTGVLAVLVRARLKKTGQEISVSYSPTGVLL